MSVFPTQALPDLTSERLLLRPISEDDLHDLFLLRSNEHVNKYLDRTTTKNLDDVKRFIAATLEGVNNQDRMYWAVCIRDSGAFAGTICLWNFSNDKSTAETGFELLPSFQGQGIMHEALKLVVNFSFETLHIKKLEACTHKNNFASTRLLEKCGFALDAEKVVVESPELNVFSLSNS